MQGEAMTEAPREVVQKDQPIQEPAPPTRAPEPPLRAFAIIVTVTILAIVALSLWYLVRS
jgi:hypothetical protein